MAVLITQITTGQTVGPTIALPMRWQPTQPISFLVNFSGNPGGPATGTVDVQVSNDPNANPGLNNPAQAALARWNAHDILVDLVTDKNSSIVYPVAYCRLIADAPGVVGTVTLQIGIPDPLP